MKRLFTALALLLALSGVAAAQTTVLSKFVGTITSPAINDTITAQDALTAAQQGSPAFMRFTAESTVVFTMSNFTKAVFYGLLTPPSVSDSTSKVRLAIALKCWPVATDSTKAVPDSLSSAITPVAGSAGFTQAAEPPPGSGPGLWPGEILVTVDPWRGLSAAAAQGAPSNRFFGIRGFQVDFAREYGVTECHCTRAQARVRVLNYISTDVTKKIRLRGWVGLYR
jgi:hypothetical protein